VCIVLSSSCGQQHCNTWFRKIIQDKVSMVCRTNRSWNSINVKADSFFVTGFLQHSVCYAALYASSHFFSRIESILGDVHLYAPVRFLRNLSSAQCYEKMPRQKNAYNNRNLYFILYYIIHTLFLYLHTNTRIHISIHTYKVYIIDGTNRFSKQGIFLS